MTEEANNLKLSDRAMLVSLRLSSWSGRLRDQEVSDEVTTRHRADRTAGAYNKQLVDSTVLRGVRAVMSRIRATHMTLTLPWSDSGRILSNMNYLHYNKQMLAGKADLEKEVDLLAQLYPAYIGSRANKARLGSMWDAKDYPKTDDLKKRFGMDMEINKVPEAADFRAKLSDASVKAIVRDIERRSEERIKTAINDVFQRIADVAEKMVESLREYKPATEGKVSENRFQDSLIYNVKQLADLLPGLNVMGDPRIDDLQKFMLEQLTAEAPEVLRINDKARKKTADDAERVLKKVRNYMQ